MSTLKDVIAVSSILGCARITVYRLVRAGKIPHIRVGKLIRFSDSHIQSFMGDDKTEETGAKNEA